MKGWQLYMRNKMGIFRIKKEKLTPKDIQYELNYKGYTARCSEIKKEFSKMNKEYKEERNQRKKEIRKLMKTETKIKMETKMETKMEMKINKDDFFNQRLKQAKKLIGKNLKILDKNCDQKFLNKIEKKFNEEFESVKYEAEYKPICYTWEIRFDNLFDVLEINVLNFISYEIKKEEKFQNQLESLSIS